MSKRLEEEYRQMVGDQVPDLWNRIEAGLREKNTPPVGQPVQQVYQQPMQQQMYQQPAQQMYQQPVQQAVQQNKPKKPVIFKILPWAGGVAAAAIIFILVIPAVVSMTRKNSSTTMNTAMKDTTYEIAPAAGAAESREEAVMQENAEAVTTDAVAGDRNYGEDERDLNDGTKSLIGNQGQAYFNQKTKTEGAQEEDAILYAKVLSILEDTNNGVTYITIYVGTDVSDVLMADKEEEQYSTLDILSEDSPLNPVKGKTYLIDYDDYGVLLMEEAK